jgi:hypothetical protein
MVPQVNALILAASNDASLWADKFQGGPPLCIRDTVEISSSIAPFISKKINATHHSLPLLFVVLSLLLANLQKNAA